MITTNKRWFKKISGIVPMLVVGSLLLVACGGTTETPTTTGGLETATTGATATTSTVDSAATQAVSGANSASTQITGGVDSAATQVAGALPGAATSVTGGAEAMATALATSIAGIGNLMTIQMNAQNGSNENGTANITPTSDGKVMVVLNLNNGTSEPQPAHIHKGTCANLDPNPAFPLTSVVNGKSETTVNVGIDQLLTQSYAVNVHKSTSEAQTYVSCGDITIAGMMNGSSGAQTPGVTSMPGSASGTGTPGAMTATAMPGMMSETGTPGMTGSTPGMMSETGTPSSTTSNNGASPSASTTP